jgi:hypothetical protein
LNIFSFEFQVYILRIDIFEPDVVFAQESWQGRTAAHGLGAPDRSTRDDGFPLAVTDLHSVPLKSLRLHSIRQIANL